MLPDRVEWPTVVVGVTIWGGLAAVLATHERMPTAVAAAGLAVLAAWYGSLQHEVIHGHPTPWRRVNAAFAAVPVGLVIPFGSYRDSHLAHHRSPALTDPDLDPESFYVTADTWARCGPVRRGALWAMRTLAGRMVLGPFLMAGRCWAQLARDAATAAGARRMVVHVAGSIAVLLVVAASGFPVWIFVVAVAWGGGALSLLRSFAEHRWTEDATRSAVVRAGPVTALLFLNNNLHHTHHQHPMAAWYRLPAVHRAIDGDRAAAAGAGLYGGYGDVVRRYLVRPAGAPVLTTASPSPAGGSDGSTAQPAPAA